MKKERGLEEITALYRSVQDEIISRLGEFKRIWETSKEVDIFAELVFCLLTPQSKARACDDALGCLVEMDLLVKGTASQIAKELKGKVRFHNTKANNMVEARKLFSVRGNLAIKEKISGFKSVYETREWLVQNVKGLGYKEASHFLRNIGMGDQLAILDRHILKNLKSLGVINEVPVSLSKKKYFEIETRMSEFAENIKIPMSHLDLLLWYKETGEIFK